MKRLRVGHFGTLHDHSAGILLCAQKFPEVFEIVGVAEDDPRLRARMEKEEPFAGLPFYTTEELLRMHLDCAFVEGHEHDLPRVAKACVERGIHVHMDKPGGRDIEVYADALRIARMKGLTFQLGYMYRYNPAVQECMQMVKNGRLGDVYAVTAIMNTGHPDEKRLWLNQFTGGIMFFLGCHMVDLVHLFQGMPDQVQSFLKESHIMGETAKDQSTAVFTYANGTSIVQANACEINGYGRRQLVVCGTKGTYEIRPLECPIGAIMTEKHHAVTFEDQHIRRDIPTVERLSRYDEMMLDFAAMARGEKANPFTYQYELDTQKLLLAACGMDYSQLRFIHL